MGGEWQSFPLEDCMEAIIDYRGKTPKKTNAGVPLITAKIVKNGVILPVSEYIASNDYDSWMRRGMPREGDVLITTEAPLGEVAQLDGRKVALAQRLIALRGKTGFLDNTFLKYQLQSNEVQSQLKGRATGTTVLGIKQSELRKVLLPVPPINEQRAIAHILGSLDDKIELNRQMNRTLEQVAQALFKSWFIDFDPVVYNAVQAGHPVPERFEATAERYRQKPEIQTLPQHILNLFPDRFEDSELGEIPVGWGAVPLEVLVEVNPKRALRKGTVATYLDMKNLPVEGMRPTDWWEREFKSGSRFINGDTLVARITPCLENGKTAYVNFLAEGEVCWGSTEYIVLRSKALLPNEFSYFLARENGFRDHAIANMTGSSGRQRVPASAVSNYLIAKANELVYEEFSRQVGPVVERIKEQDDENRTLASMRNTLLPEFISGDRRVPDIEKMLEGL